MTFPLDSLFHQFTQPRGQPLRMELRVEDRRLPSHGRHLVAVGSLPPGNQPVQSQPPQVIGHPPGRARARLRPQSSQRVPQFPRTEPIDLATEGSPIDGVVVKWQYSNVSTRCAGKCGFRWDWRAEFAVDPRRVVGDAGGFVPVGFPIVLRIRSEARRGQSSNAEFLCRFNYAPAIFRYKIA